MHISSLCICAAAAQNLVVILKFDSSLPLRTDTICIRAHRWCLLRVENRGIAVPRSRPVSFQLVGNDLQSMLLAKIAKAFDQSGEEEDVANANVEFRPNGAMDVAGGGPVDRHEVDAAGIAQTGALDGPSRGGTPLGKAGAEQDALPAPVGEEGGGAFAAISPAALPRCASLAPCHVDDVGSF